MTAAFCTQCGAPVSARFCDQCGNPVAAPVIAPPEMDATVVRSTPLVPPSIDFPPPLYVADPAGTVRPSTLPERTVTLPPPYVAPGPATASPQQDRTRFWLSLGAVVALLAGAFCMWFFGLRSDSHPAAATGVTGSTNPTISIPTTPAPPGTVPSIPWMTAAGVGGPGSGARVLTGRAAFVSHGGNACAISAVNAGTVVCTAMPGWKHSCAGGSTGPWAVFALVPNQRGATSGCTEGSSEASSLTAGVKRLAAGSYLFKMDTTGVWCAIISGSRASQSGVACWNPTTRHGFLIANEDQKVW